MESTPILYIILAVSAASLAILVYLALKMKAVVYLLEQPVVKKMSPQLKLKPVKLDELMADRNRHSQAQNRDPRQPGSIPGNAPRQGGRPDGERREGNRGDRPQGGQGSRPERGEGDRRDGERNRGNDRFRDRNRGDRPQGSQGGRPEGDRRPPREFNENRDQNRESSVSVSQPSQPVIRNEAPVSTPQQDAPLSPRRPLPATVETHEHRNTAAPSFEGGSEAFVGTDNDMQHGRRTQMKKKPRFEMDEAEVKIEG